MYFMNFIFIRWNMTSSSYFNILMMSSIAIICVSLWYMFLSTISSIGLSLRLTLNISLTLIRMMNSLSSNNFTLSISSWLNFFIFCYWLNILIWLRYNSFCSSYYMWLTLTLISGLNIRLRCSFYMILTITFINNFNTWISFFIFSPTIIYSSFYITILNISILWLTLNISFSLGHWLSINISFSLSCWLRMYISLSISCWLTLNITMWISLSLWLTLNISSSWLIGVIIWSCIYISSCWVCMYNRLLLIIKMNRLFFLFKCCHVWIMIIIILLRWCTLNIIILRCIKEIILLFYLNWCIIYLNWCGIYLNWGCINLNWGCIYINRTTFITMSY